MGQVMQQQKGEDGASAAAKSVGFFGASGFLQGGWFWGFRALEFRVLRV